MFFQYYSLHLHRMYSRLTAWRENGWVILEQKCMHELSIPNSRLKYSKLIILLGAYEVL